MDLRELGWNHFFEEHFTDYKEKGLVPARVIREHKHIYQVHTEHGPVTAALAGKIDYDAQTKADYPLGCLCMTSCTMMLMDSVQ